MSTILLTDLFRVLLFPKDLTYFGDLDPLYLSKYHLSDYNFSQYFNLNSELLDFFRTLPPTVSKHLFTAAQEFVNSAEAQQNIIPIFKSVYTTQNMGMRKSDTESYQYICTDLQVFPKEIVYIGDNMTNINSATKAGIQAVQYINNSQIISKLRTFFLP